MMIGVICTCAPSFNQFLQEHRPRTKEFKSYFRSQSSSARRYERTESIQNQDPRMPHQGQRRGRPIAESKDYELNDSRCFQSSTMGASEVLGQEDVFIRGTKFSENDRLVDRFTMASGDEHLQHDQGI